MSSRVLMTADAVGGVWTYALELAAALPDSTRIVLATMGPAPSMDQLREAAAIRHLEVRTFDGALEWMPDPWEDVDRAGEWLLALEEEVRPDVIQINGFVHAALPFDAPVLSVAHSCVTSWWRAVHGQDPPPSWLEYRRRVQQGLRKADLVVAPTEAMLAALRSCYRFDTRAITIPNGVAIDPFQPRVKQPIVFSAGRLWDEAKNLRTLLEAAPSISWPIQIAGDGGGLRAEGVEVLGWLSREEIRTRLEVASVFVHPAVYEPFGLAPLEAALAGCALVLADIPSLRENWDGAAMFVDPLDASAISEAVSSLIERPTERVRLAAAARERGLRLDADSMAAAYCAVWSTLARASGGKGDEAPDAAVTAPPAEAGVAGTEPFPPSIELLPTRLFPADVPQAAIQPQERKTTDR